VAGGRAAARSLWVQAVSGGLSGLAALISGESVLEVCTRQCGIQSDAFACTFRKYMYKLHSKNDKKR